MRILELSRGVGGRCVVGARFCLSEWPVQATEQEARRVHARVAGDSHVRSQTVERRHACFHIGMFLDICVGATAVQKSHWKCLIRLD